VTLELADNVQIKVQRHAISSIMPKGTIKSA
jgi:preprotein translocase subunit YajC